MIPLRGDLAPALAPVPFQEATGVDVPLFPVIVVILGLLALLVVGLGALKMPRRVPRPTPTPRRTAARPAAVPSTAAPAPAPATVASPVYRKAPVSIELPQIKPDYPDVWGLGDPVDIALRTTDPDLKAKKTVPGLALRLGAESVALVFSNGASVTRRRFAQRGEQEIIAEYTAPEEPEPRRTTRKLRIVDYREEIAEVFHNFKQEASRAITPLREDATPWEIYDTLTEAKADLPRQAIRDIVASFEEAKFSNHAVTRATYEKIISALLQLERVEL